MSPRQTRNHRIVLVIVCTILALPGAASGATGLGTAGVSVNGGLVASGLASSASGSELTMTFVIPRGALGFSPVAGVDFSKPWGSLTVQPGNGATFGVESHQACAVVTNPSTWTTGYEPINDAGDPAQPLSGIYFDTPCQDGSGYDFYRVQWDDYPDPWTGRPEHVFIDGLRTNTYYWGSTVQTRDAHGTVTSFDDAIESARVSVYGHDAHGLHPVTLSGIGNVVPAASVIAVTGAG